MIRIAGLLTLAAAATSVLTAPERTGQESQGTHLLVEWVVREAGEEFRHEDELWVVDGRLRIDDTVFRGDELYLRVTWSVAGPEGTIALLVHEQRTYMVCTPDEFLGPVAAARQPRGRDVFVSREERLEAVPLDEERQIGPWLAHGFLIKEEGPEELITHPTERETLVTTVKRGLPLLELWLAEEVAADARSFAAQMVSALGVYLERQALDQELFRVLLAVHEDRLDRSITGFPVELRWPGLDLRYTIRRAEQLPIPDAVFEVPVTGYQREDCPFAQ